jgi:allophanate hydrolase subunit 2
MSLADDAAPTLAIESIGPLATLQDRGRPVRASLGIPRGGPLDEPLFEATTGALKSLGVAASNAIELPLSGATLRALTATVVSIDGALRALVEGEAIVVPASTRAVRYVAIALGVAVESVLDGDGTTLFALDPPAGFGGVEGRALGRGEILRAPRCPREAIDRVRGLGARASLPTARDARHAALDLRLSSTLDPAVAHWLVATSHRLTSDSTRIATRLAPSSAAPPVTALASSRPRVRGAVQLPPTGALVVIGPDGPTTGGYLCVGVVDRASQSTLARLRPDAVGAFRAI